MADYPRLSKILAGGVYYYQLKAGKGIEGIVGKKALDGSMNASQILEASGFTNNEKRKGLETIRAKSSSSKTEYGPLNPARGTWIPPRDTILIVQQYHLELLLAPLLNALITDEAEDTPMISLPRGSKAKKVASEIELVHVDGVPMHCLKTSTVVVHKRCDNNWFDATHILRAVGLPPGKRKEDVDWLCKYSVLDQRGRTSKHSTFDVAVIGIWMSYSESMALAKKWGVYDLLLPLFDQPLEVDDVGLVSEKVVMVQSAGESYYVLEIGKGKVTKKVFDDWINATQILIIAGIEKSKRKPILNTSVRNGIHRVVENAGHTITGIWVPYDRTINLAKTWKVLDLIAPLIGEFEEFEDDDADELEARDERTKWVETLYPSAHKSHHQQRGEYATTMGSQRASEPSHTKRHLLDNVGQLIVISRNNSEQDGKAGRESLLRDGMMSAKSFLYNFGLQNRGRAGRSRFQWRAIDLSCSLSTPSPWK